MPIFICTCALSISQAHSHVEHCYPKAKGISIATIPTADSIGQFWSLVSNGSTRSLVKQQYVTLTLSLYAHEGRMTYCMHIVCGNNKPEVTELNGQGFFWEDEHILYMIRRILVPYIRIFSYQWFDIAMSQAMSMQVCHRPEYLFGDLRGGLFILNGT